MFDQVKFDSVNLYTFCANSADNKPIITPPPPPPRPAQEKQDSIQIVFIGNSLKRQFVSEVQKPALREKKETT